MRAFARIAVRMGVPVSSVPLKTPAMRMTPRSTFSRVVATATAPAAASPSRDTQTVSMTPATTPESSSR